MNRYTTAVAGAALAGTMLVAPAQAEVSHTIPTTVATDDYLIKAAVRITWQRMSAYEKRTLCAGFWIDPSRIVNAIARPSIREGVAPSWQIKPIIRRFLVRAC